MSRPDGPYGSELLWGYPFLDIYREPLDDLYLTPEVLACARASYFASFVNGVHSMSAEKRIARSAFEESRFAETIYPFRFIVDDVLRRGNSYFSALISIQAALMLFDTDVIHKPTQRHVPIDYNGPVKAQSVDAVLERPEKVTPKCDNCAYLRNPERCPSGGMGGVCEDYFYAAPTPEYYPTWDEERRRMLESNVDNDIH